jgi:rhamnogalacturonyl hydrolase YesR
MKTLIFTFFIIAFFFQSQSNGQSTSKKSVLKLAQKVADWQLENPKDTFMGDWVQGPFVNGLMAVGKLPHGEKYIQAAKDIGKRANWGVIKTAHRANDHCTPQAWIELYEIEKNPELIGAIQHELDRNMDAVAILDNDLTFKSKNGEKWSWCDALFMSPPTFARMGKISGEQKYYDFLNKWWWKVSAFYYDTDQHLYFRDETFFAKREPNGLKVFWSRGNGWVVGGLVRVLQYLPANDPYRRKYEQQLREMCNKIREVQGEDGLWGAGMLDRNAHKQAETSGSAFFLYGMAYAINHGIVDKDVFIPVVEKTWNALCNYVKPDGRFTGIQPIGDSPAKYNEDYSMPYGVGAFLLAASEMYELLENNKNE